MNDLSAISPRLDRLLRARRVVVLSALLGVILSLPAVGRHLSLDDFVLGLAARGHPEVGGLAQGKLDLFTFTTGRVEDNRELMARGVLLPWWTTPDLKIAFFRPLASITHHLDFAMWPTSARAMVVHSLLWLAASVVAVGFLYRTVGGATSLAGLSILLYAIDDARGPVVAWVSNRNALIATALAALAIAAHVRFRRDGSRLSGVLAPLLFLSGLLAGELALGALAYLVSYALLLDPARDRTRFLALVPYGAVVALWRLGYARAGFGAHGSGAYLDPAKDTFEFVKALPVRWLALLHGQFGLPPSDVAFLGKPEHFPLFVGLSVLTACVVAFVAWKLLQEDAEARFYLAGALMAAVPVSASFSSDRLLPLVGIGGSALVARIAARSVAAFRGRARDLRTLCGLGLLAINGVAAPLLLPFRAAQMQMLGAASEAATRAMPPDPGLEDKIVLIVNAPVTLLSTYIQVERAFRGQPAPARVYLLATAGAPLSVDAPNEGELRIRPDGGFLQTPLDRHYRASTVGLEPRTRIALPGLSIEVHAVLGDGRPSDVRFQLDTSELDRYELWVWQDGRYVVQSLPRPGELLRLPAEDLGQILLRSVFPSP